MGSSVNVKTSYGLNDRNSLSSRTGIFLFATRTDRISVTPNTQHNGRWMKQCVRATKHSLTYRVVTKNEYSPSGLKPPCDVLPGQEIFHAIWAASNSRESNVNICCVCVCVCVCLVLVTSKPTVQYTRKLV
jgi:hypothetical protein